MQNDIVQNTVQHWVRLSISCRKRSENLCLLGDSSDKQPTMLCGSREPGVRWVSLNHAFPPSGCSASDPPALCHVRFSPLPEHSRRLPEPRTCSPGWDPRVGTQPSRVAAHLLLSDVQLQLDMELPSTAACLFSNPSFQAPVLNRAPVLQCATGTTLCRSSVPLLSHSFLSGRSRPSASPGHTPLSFEVLPHIAAPLRCLSCLRPQVLVL